MDEIASKYWEKDTKVSTVYISFYNGKIDKNDKKKESRVQYIYRVL